VGDLLVLVVAMEMSGRLGERLVGATADQDAFFVDRHLLDERARFLA
jgi:hypothetical protein